MHPAVVLMVAAETGVPLYILSLIAACSHNVLLSAGVCFPVMYPFGYEKARSDISAGPHCLEFRSRYILYIPTLAGNVPETEQAIQTHISFSSGNSEKMLFRAGLGLSRSPKYGFNAGRRFEKKRTISAGCMIYVKDGD